MAGHVVRLKNDWTSLREAAITVNLAFSNDPLINWIRPGARPWKELDKDSLKFQHRRLKRMNQEFVVLRLDQRCTSPPKDPEAISVSEKEVNHDKSRKYGVIAMLEPPAQDGFTFRKLYCRIKYRLLDMLDPCSDPGGNEKRFLIMMEAHNNGLETLRKQLLPRRPWYIEVIAVRPSLHGLGLGGQMMRGIIEMAGDAPIVLECTDKATIPFYQKYGFEEVSKMVLEDSSQPVDNMACFWMVRR